MVRYVGLAFGMATGVQPVRDAGILVSGNKDQLTIILKHGLMIIGSGAWRFRVSSPHQEVCCP